MRPCWRGWTCPYMRENGRSVFHLLPSALAVATDTNKAAGRKIVRVIMDDGHYRVASV